MTDTKDKSLKDHESHRARTKLIERAIAEYNGESGGAKGPNDLAAALPQHARTAITPDGGTFVMLFARSVAATLVQVAAYEVVEREPDLVHVDRDALPWEVGE